MAKTSTQLKTYKKQAEEATLKHVGTETEFQTKVKELTCRLDKRMIEYETLLKERNELAAANDSSNDGTIDREVFSQLVVCYWTLLLCNNIHNVLDQVL